MGQLFLYHKIRAPYDSAHQGRACEYIVTILGNTGLVAIKAAIDPFSYFKLYHLHFYL